MNIRFRTVLDTLLSGCGHSHIERNLLRARQCMANRLDSALRILESLEPSELSGRDTRAQYAVLYAEAADRAGVAAACDSLLLHAREYYRQQPHEVRNFCRTLYYLGRGKLRQGDKPGALRQFLEVEEHLRRIDEPRYLGLLYLRIGDIYRSELNSYGPTVTIGKPVTCSCVRKTGSIRPRHYWV